MNIKFTQFDENRSNLPTCEICDESAIGYLDFEGFNEGILVCYPHKNSITEDNVLLVPYLRLLDACC